MCSPSHSPFPTLIHEPFEVYNLPCEIWILRTEPFWWWCHYGYLSLKHGVSRILRERKNKQTKNDTSKGLTQSRGVRSSRQVQQTAVWLFSSSPLSSIPPPHPPPPPPLPSVLHVCKQTERTRPRTFWSLSMSGPPFGSWWPSQIYLAGWLSSLLIQPLRRPLSRSLYHSPGSAIAHWPVSR